MVDAATEPASEPTAAIVVLAAGSGSRVGADVNKVLLPLAGRPLLAWSVAVAQSVSGVGPVIVVCRPGERDVVASVLAPHIIEMEVLLIDGGLTRQASEQAALELLAPRIHAGSVDVIAIHDGARPLVDVGLFEAVIAAARVHGGAVPTHEMAALIARAAPTRLGSERVVGVQTPQAFRAAPLVAAYSAAKEAGFDGTDTAAAFTAFATEPGLNVHAVQNDSLNVKVTFAEDLVLAEHVLSSR